MMGTGFAHPTQVLYLIAPSYSFRGLKALLISFGNGFRVSWMIGHSHEAAFE